MDTEAQMVALEQELREMQETNKTLRKLLICALSHITDESEFLISQPLFDGIDPDHYLIVENQREDGAKSFKVVHGGEVL